MVTHIKTTSTLLLLTASMLVIAPLLRSGKTATAVMILELLGLALLVVVVWTKTYKNKLPRPISLFIFFSIASVIIYIIPIPHDLWLAIPNRDLYTNILQWVDSDQAITVAKTLSLAPLLSLSVLLSCIPALAIFLVAISLSEKNLTLAIYFFLLSATIQSGIALLQYLTHDPLFYFGVSSIQGSQGTYLNRNHFTAFMEMAEPVALALMIHALVEQRHSTAIKALKVFIFAAISLLLTFMAFTTTSRMGTVLLILSILISFWAMTTPGIRKKVAVPMLALRLSLLGIILFAQYHVVSTIAVTTARAQPELILGDLRWHMFSASWEAIKTFFPFGSGPGTMPQIAPAFLPEDNPVFQTMFINHVHNDYLELLFEMGVFGLIIILSFFALYIIQWRHIHRAAHTLMNLLQSGAGIGILIFLIFGLSDFNLHTPANAIFLSFLCGIFFRKTGTHAKT